MRLIAERPIGNDSTNIVDRLVPLRCFHSPFIKLIFKCGGRVDSASAYCAGSLPFEPWHPTSAKRM